MSPTFPATDKLPGYLISEILSRLPVKSLVRFQAVCKAWLTGIHSPVFVQLQLQRTANTNNNRPHHLIVHGINYEAARNADVELLTLVELTTPQNVARILTVSDSFRRSAAIHSPASTVMIVVGSFNGIVCVMVMVDKVDASEHPLFLWNPATRESKEIVRPNIDSRQILWFSIGFGFDPVSNNYKIVRVLEFGDDSVRVEIYTVKEDRWKEISVGVRVFLNFYKCEVSVNGMLYWSGQEQTLVSFDLKNEVFNDQIKFPDYNVTGGNERIFIEFRGSVGLVVLNNIVGQHGINLWSLDDENGEGSWSMKFKSEEIPWMLWIFSYFESDEIVASHRDGNLVLYNTRNRSSERMLMPMRVITKGVYNYHQTLVSPNDLAQLQ